MASDESGTYLSLQRVLETGNTVPELSRSRRSRLRLELVRRISRLQEAQDRAAAEDAAEARDTRSSA